MSILIKGMEMPKNCFVCPLFDDVYTDADGDDDYRCDLGVPLDYYQASGETKKDCPLVPVPPHGRLIDADAAVANRNADMNWCYDLYDLPDYLSGCPTIIPPDPEEEGE